MNHRKLLIIKPNNYNSNTEYNKYIQESKTTFAIQSQKERNIKRINKFNHNSNRIKVCLYGLDGTIKKIWNKWPTWNIINKQVDTMPIRQKEINYSLYSDDHPNTTIHDIGFKNKEVAIKSLQKIKKIDKNRQKQIVNIMIQRAKYHPHQTKNMRDAIKIYETFIKQLKLDSQ